MRSFIFGALMLLIFLTVSCGFLRPHKLPPGTDAADFSLKDLNNKEIKLSNYRGKVVLLNFWATWCPPCVKEIPDLIKVQQTYKSKGLEIIGVSMDTGSEDDIKKFVKRFEINYPVVVGDLKIVNDYGNISAIPTTFFIDRTGKVQTQVQGGLTTEEIEKIIEDLLAANP